MQPKFNSKPLIAVIAAVVVIAGVVLLARKQDPAAATTATEETTGSGNLSGSVSGVSVTASGTAQTAAAQYQDGKYTANGQYNSPGGTEIITVSLTIANGIVTDSTVTSGATDPTSRRYQAMFIAGYKQYVTGMSLDSINVGKVSGSSLTAQGFNDAVAKIKSVAAVS